MYCGKPPGTQFYVVLEGRYGEGDTIDIGADEGIICDQCISEGPKEYIRVGELKLKFNNR